MGGINKNFVPELYLQTTRTTNVYTLQFLIIVQRDATLSSLFIIPQVHPTRFGC